MPDPTDPGSSPSSDPSLLVRLRSLTREEKLELFARGVESARTARAERVASPADGSRVIRLRLPGNRSLAYRLSPDDLAL